MSTAEDYRVLAERCLRAAKAAHNVAVSQVLKAMAANYFERADALAPPSPVVQQQQQPQPPKTGREPA